MANPLDYWDGQSERSTAGRAEVDPPREPAAAVPVEFEALVVRTTDHAGAQAVIRALDRKQILHHESSDGQRAQREVFLRVHAADAERARLIAAEIFARREKFKRYPKAQPLRDMPWTNWTMPDLPGSW